MKKKKKVKEREIDVSTFQTACFFHVNGRNDSYLAHWKMFVGLSVLPKVFHASLLLIGIYVLFFFLLFFFFSYKNIFNRHLSFYKQIFIEIVSPEFFTK